jgi:hypothetical protein
MGDYLVLITSEGEVAIFNGYDPSNAATWALVGVFNMGKPMSKRCTSKNGWGFSCIYCYRCMAII